MKVELDGQELEQVKELVYLGSRNKKYVFVVTLITCEESQMSVWPGESISHVFPCEGPYDDVR